MVGRLACLHQILNSVNIIYSDHITTHELGSNYSFTRWRDRILDYWHLLTPGCSLIKRTSEEVTNLVRDSDSDNHWSEDLDVLGCLHENYSERVRHPCVTCHESRTSQYYVAADNRIALIIVISKYQSHEINTVIERFTECTSNDHTWEEESGWHVSSISCNGEEIPNCKENKYVGRAHVDRCVHDVFDDGSFAGPEETCIWVNFTFGTPSLIGDFSLLSSTELIFTYIIVCKVYEIWCSTKNKTRRERP